MLSCRCRQHSRYGEWSRSRRNWAGLALAIDSLITIVVGCGEGHDRRGHNAADIDNNDAMVSTRPAMSEKKNFRRSSRGPTVSYYLLDLDHAAAAAVVTRHPPTAGTRGGVRLLPTLHSTTHARLSPAKLHPLWYWNIAADLALPPEAT